MAIATLILVSVLNAGVSAPVPVIQSFPNEDTCAKVLQATLEGARMVHEGNATAPHVAVTKQEGAWLVLRTPARVVMQGRCL